MVVLAQDIFESVSKVSFMSTDSPSVLEEECSGLLFLLKYWARQLWCPRAARGTQVLHIFRFLSKFYTSGNWLVRKIVITIHQSCISMCLAMYTQRDFKKSKCHTEKYEYRACPNSGCQEAAHFWGQGLEVLLKNRTNLVFRSWFTALYITVYCVG